MNEASEIVTTLANTNVTTLSLIIALLALVVLIFFARAQGKQTGALNKQSDALLKQSDALYKKVESDAVQNAMIKDLTQATASIAATTTSSASAIDKNLGVTAETKSAVGDLNKSMTDHFDKSDKLVTDAQETLQSIAAQLEQVKTGIETLKADTVTWNSELRKVMEGLMRDVTSTRDTVLQAASKITSPPAQTVAIAQPSPPGNGKVEAPAP